MAVTLLRHGETNWNVLKRVQGKAPVPLNSTGREQALSIVEQLKPLALDSIVASDLLRARQTAEIIDSALHLPVVFDSRWQEVDVGTWQGVSTDELEKWDSAAWQNFLKTDYLERAFPDGESQQQLGDRSAAAFEALDKSKNILVITHGGCIRSVLYYLFQEIQHAVLNCEPFILDYVQSAWIKRA